MIKPANLTETIQAQHRASEERRKAESAAADAEAMALMDAVSSLEAQINGLRIGQDKAAAFESKLLELVKDNGLTERIGKQFTQMPSFDQGIGLLSGLAQREAAIKHQAQLVASFRASAVELPKAQLREFLAEKQALFKRTGLWASVETEVAEVLSQK